VGEIRGIYGFLFGKRLALGAIKHLLGTAAEGGFLRAGKKGAKLFIV
jgi:hypothetical protein